MKKVDTILSFGAFFLVIAPVAFYFFLENVSQNLDNGEGMAILAFVLFYSIFHAIVALSLILFGFFKFRKFKALKRTKSIILLSLLFLLGFVPAIIIFF